MSMKAEQMKTVKKFIKYLGKAVSILSIIFIIRAVYVLGFDFSAVHNWPVFLGVALLCTVAKCITVYVSGTAWYRWLNFFSGTKCQRKEALCVYAKANIGKYLPGNVMHYVERNLFAGKLGISQKKIAASTVFEVFTLVSAAFLIGITVSFGQLQSAFYNVFGENYIQIIAGVILAGIVCLIVAAFLFKKKIASVLAEYKLSDFLLAYIGNVLLYMIVLITLGIIMVVLYCYMGGTFQLRSAALIVSGFTIAWVLGFIVPGAPGGIGVRELVITLLLSSVVGESLIVTLSVTHRLITIVGDFMAYLVMLIIRWRCMEPDNR